MNSDPNGPSKDTLRNLKGMMGSFIKGMHEQRLEGKGRLVARGTLKPRKVCPVCGALFDKITTTAEISLTPENCKDCAAMLKDGYTAIVCGKKSAFIKSEKLADKAGQIMMIGEEVFAQCQERFNLKVKERDDADL